MCIYKYEGAWRHLTQATVPLNLPPAKMQGDAATWISGIVQVYVHIHMYIALPSLEGTMDMVMKMPERWRPSHIVPSMSVLVVHVSNRLSDWASPIEHDSVVFPGSSAQAMTIVHDQSCPKVLRTVIWFVRDKYNCYLWLTDRHADAIQSIQHQLRMWGNLFIIPAERFVTCYCQGQ